jgi:hypothetical protein
LAESTVGLVACLFALKQCSALSTGAALKPNMKTCLIEPFDILRQLTYQFASLFPYLNNCRRIFKYYDTAAVTANKSTKATATEAN